MSNTRSSGESFDTIIFPEMSIVIVSLVLRWTRFWFDQSPRSIELSPRSLLNLSTAAHREKLLKVVSWAQISTEVGRGNERDEYGSLRYSMS